MENKVKKKKKEYHINFIIELNGPSGTLCHTPWDTRRDATSLFLSGFVCYFCVCLCGSLRVNVCVCVFVCAPALFCVFLFSSKLPFIRFEVPLILGSIWLRILRFRICVSKNKPKVKFMTMCATPSPPHSGIIPVKTLTIF